MILTSRNDHLVCEIGITNTLINFPESGRLIPELGKDIRKISFKKYCFVYQLKANVIEILTVYRENKP